MHHYSLNYSHKPNSIAQIRQPRAGRRRRCARRTATTTANWLASRWNVCAQASERERAAGRSDERSTLCINYTRPVSTPFERAAMRISRLTTRKTAATAAAATTDAHPARARAATCVYHYQWNQILTHRLMASPKFGFTSTAVQASQNGMRLIVRSREPNKASKSAQTYVNGVRARREWVGARSGWAFAFRKVGRAQTGSWCGIIKSQH